LKEFKFEFEAMHTLAHVFSFFFLFLLGKPTKEINLAILFAASKNLVKEDTPFVISSWTRGEEEEPEVALPEPSFLSLPFDHLHQRQPPMGLRHLC
jgi:hypothetical protein